VAYTRKIKAGLVPIDPSDFVGEQGIIFYNTDTGSQFLSDGVTPGGIPINVAGSGGGNGYTGSQGLAGATGSQGLTGATGPQGNPGPTGDNGATGATGPQGEMGFTGSQGTAGADGAPGPAGANGADGAPGTAGNDGAPGPQGDPGPAGANGAAGATGPRGLTGTQGVSVTLQGTKATINDLPLTGNPGDGWIVTTGDGLTHQDGSLWFWNIADSAWNDIGPIVGPQGDPGDIGATGPQGDPGPAGADGADGAPGTAGADGAPGTAGADGAPGQDGAPGADALWNWQGAYDAGPMYQDGDIVSYQGSTYRRNATGNSVVGEPPTNATYWQIVSQKGADGAAGVDANPDAVVNGVHNITLNATGDFIPNSDNLQDLGSPTNRFRHLYVGPGSVYIGSNVITESDTGGLVIPGLTKATGYYADGVDDEDEWGNNPVITGTVTVIDALRYQLLSGIGVPGPNHTPAIYTAEKQGNRIDEITVTNGGGGWTKGQADYARNNNMYATNVADAIDNFNAGDWVQIPFRVEVKAEDTEYEDIFGGSSDRLVSGDAEVVLSSNNDLTIPGVIKSTSGTSYIDPADNYVVLQTAQDVRWTFASDGELGLPEGGIITEGVVTGNPTIQLTPATPDVASQKLVIKGGGSYTASDNGIGLNWFIINPLVGDTVEIYVNSPDNANQTLYWWIYSDNTPDDIATPNSGTVILNNGGAGDFGFTVDSDDYEFTVRVSPINNQYIPANTGVETLVFNEAAPNVGDHHLHLTTGDLTETSIILGTDEHNVRTTAVGDIEINTYNYSEDVSNTWTFENRGALRIPAGGDIVNSSGQSVLGGNYSLPTASDSVLGGIKIGAGLSIDGNGVVTSSGSVTTVVRQDTPPNAGNGTLWFNTVEGRLYIKYSDAWVDAAPLMMPAPDTDIDVVSITFPDGSTQTTAYTSAVVGYTGSIGFTGSAGAQGVTGFTGSQGNTGATGVVGFTGSQGEIGAQGVTGFTGSAGNAGSVGTQGDVGFTGSAGSVGFTGSAGSAGTQGNVGFTGSAGSAGTQGDVGFTGSAGTFTGTTSLQINTSNTTVSTSTTTGALVVAGGAGIAGEVFVGGNVTAIAATATVTSTAASVGYMGVPQNERTGSYTLVIGDAGKQILMKAGGALTIPPNSSVPFPIGTTIDILSYGGTTTTISASPDSIFAAGAGATGTRTLGGFGWATLIKVDTTVWYIRGEGLT
jgi:hypothetical protein